MRESQEFNFSLLSLAHGRYDDRIQDMLRYLGFPHSR